MIQEESHHSGCGLESSWGGWEAPGGCLPSGEQVEVVKGSEEKQREGLCSA